MEIAYGSLLEMISQAAVAQELGYLDQESFAKLHGMAQELARMLSGLRASLLRG